MANDEVPQDLVPDDQLWQDLALRASLAFTPNTPIDERALFAGRDAQMRRIVDAINQTGQHAILFGERGVGKTSLANVLSQFLPFWGQKGAPVIAPRVNCDSGDSFKSIWHKIFDKIALTHAHQPPGFDRPQETSVISPADLLGDDKATPDSVRRVLTIMSTNAATIVIVDEFDRLKQQPRHAFADLIKNLSDHAVPATVVVVGVADSVGELIREHQSIARALVQIQMPRMGPDEIEQIIDKGTIALGMTIDVHARERITRLAKGLPHYAHLIGLHAARAALDNRSLGITLDAINAAIGRAIQDAQHSIHAAYHAATRSPRKDNLFSDVLLACALAEVDELGFFAAPDVRRPMREITGKNYDIPSYAKHLKEFSNEKRGYILQKVGQERRYRYRFCDPLMQPFVIMQGMVHDKLPGGFLNKTFG